MPARPIDALRTQVSGSLLAPEDPGYEDARHVFNAMIDRHPTAVVRPADTADVVAAVRFAAEAGTGLAVRGGGHSAPGFGTADGALVVDLSGTATVSVDPVAGTARAGGGATWGDFNDATGAYGLATTGGLISTTGVAGLTLGGGIGFLTRAYGLSCDNLLSAQVVTADGHMVTASEHQHADLFWALRGGGGNFGVVTEFTFLLHQVTEIYGGPMFFELSDGPAPLAYFDEFIATAPRAYGGFPGIQMAPPLLFMPADRVGEPLLVIVSCWTGSIIDGERIIQRFRDVARPVAEHVSLMPYAVINHSSDAMAPRGMQHHWKTSFLGPSTPATVAVHLGHGPHVPTGMSFVHQYPVNGACHDVAPGATAFAQRGATSSVLIAGAWPDPADTAANTRWVRDYFAALAPFALAGGYANFASLDDQPKAAVSYGANYPRLQEVKRRYDPDNVFRFNQNIAP